jgi:hypothetical protein
MAEFFVANQVRAVAVHSGPQSAPRAGSLEKLRDGELDVVCCVDMFNEGVDIPTVDTILMLRPTESRILWLQQIGRGLRRAEGKPHVTVIDYIGNHRTFLIKPLTLLAAANSVELRKKLELAIAQELALPPGCQVTYELESVDILRGLLKTAGLDALQSYYEQFLELHGARPSAREAFHDSRTPRSARKNHGSWLGFVAAQRDGLSDEQRLCYERQRGFLEMLEQTEMTRSYKMLVLEAMLARDAFPGRLSAVELAEEVARLANRTPRLRDEFGAHLRDEHSLIRHLEKNPIAAWVGGKGTAGQTYFRYEEGEFSSTVRVEQRSAFQDLVREIVEWRLAEYLDRPRPSTAAVYECKVSHASGKPILFLPSRETSPGLPLGWTQVRCNESTYEANFVKIAVNVMREPGSEGNVLPQVMRGWFGPDAGMRGTSFRVHLEREGEVWRMRPAER